MIDNGQLVDLLRKRCEEWGGQRQWANANGLSESLVSMILARKQKPGPKIARALGLRKKVGWVASQGDEKAL